MITKNLGDRIKALRSEIGLSQEKFAQKVAQILRQYGEAPHVLEGVN